MSTHEHRSTVMTEPSIPAGARIGHVHLKVADLDRAIGFYQDSLGFDLVFQYGTQAAFLSAGGYHHHIGLNTWESKGGTPPPRGTTGLYHFAINYPERRDLAAALKRLYDHGWQIDGASDHGTHEALYLHDPDHNGIELAWDRSPEHWYRHGEPVFERKPLDFASLLAELDGVDAGQYLPALAGFR
jgi:catechol 2,3-dioxygenase